MTRSHRAMVTAVVTVALLTIIGICLALAALLGQHNNADTIDGCTQAIHAEGLLNMSDATRPVVKAKTLPACDRLPQKDIDRAHDEAARELLGQVMGDGQ